MFEVIANIKLHIMMHMRGTPQTMQSMTHYEDIVKKCFLFSAKNK
jgi:dihydropteroate synthase